MGATQKYIQFPVSMLPEIYSNSHRFFDKVLSIGAYLYADKIDAVLVNVASQMLYHYITSPDEKLTLSLITFIESQNGVYVDGVLFEIYGDKDGRCTYFHPDGTFVLWGADVLLSRILQLHPDVLDEAFSWYKLLQACKYFDITQFNTQAIYRDVAGIRTEGQPICMVNLHLVWDYYLHKKTDAQLAQFAGFAAIKSILGKKDFVLTNKQHIAARMFGATSTKTLPEQKHPLMGKYQIRHHIDKLIKQLELSWNLKIMTSKGLHGMYMSFKMSYDQMAFMAESRKMKHKLNMIKDAKAAARQKAIQQLNK